MCKLFYPQTTLSTRSYCVLVSAAPQIQIADELSVLQGQERPQSALGVLLQVVILHHPEKLYLRFDLVDSISLHPNSTFFRLSLRPGAPTSIAQTRARVQLT
jgi:hypothetical protein